MYVMLKMRRRAILSLLALNDELLLVSLYRIVGSKSTYILVRIQMITLTILGLGIPDKIFWHELLTTSYFLWNQSLTMRVISFAIAIPILSGCKIDIYQWTADYDFNITLTLHTSRTWELHVIITYMVIDTKANKI